MICPKCNKPLTNNATPNSSIRLYWCKDCNISYYGVTEENYKIFGSDGWCIGKSIF